MAPRLQQASQETARLSFSSSEQACSSSELPSVLLQDKMHQPERTKQEVDSGLIQGPLEHTGTWRGLDHGMPSRQGAHTKPSKRPTTGPWKKQPTKFGWPAAAGHLSNSVHLCAEQPHMGGAAHAAAGRSSVPTRASRGPPAKRTAAGRQPRAAAKRTAGALSSATRRASAGRGPRRG
jgi:hypothetical protein